MRLPEPLFVIINPMMRMLLRSPLHFVQSKSLMLITFTGRKSGRRLTTPVRYVRVGDTVRCFTAPENSGGAICVAALRCPCVSRESNDPTGPRSRQIPRRCATP